jgi:peptide/nickel transport system substrate-binding protein
MLGSHEKGKTEALKQGLAATRSSRRQFLKTVAVAVGGVAAGRQAIPAGVPTIARAATSARSKLTIAQGFSPTVLSPYLAGGPQQMINITEQWVEKLIEWSPDPASFEPRLATAWTQLDDTTLQIKLRRGVKFANGEAFDAETAKFSLDKQVQVKDYVAFMDMIARIDVVDKYTINVKTKYPTLLHMQGLAWGSYQYPPSYFNQVGADAFNQKPIGTGPYRLVEWVKDSHVTMEANGNYWGGRPPLDTIEFRTIPEAAARMAALETGEIDFMIDVPLDAVGRVERNSTLQLFSRPSLRLFSLRFSEVNDTPLRKAKVRQALLYAIDVDGLIKGLFQGRAVALRGQLLAPGYFGYDASRKPTPYDPERAKRLLAEAGNPDGFEITFKYPSGRYAQDKEVGQAISTQLGKVGVRTKQVVLEGGTFITQLQTKQLNDMYLGGNLPPPDAHFMFLDSVSTHYYSVYSDSKFDALYYRAGRTAKRDERIQLYKEILDVFDQDPPFRPLYQPLEFYAATKKLSGFSPRGMQFLDLRAFKMS